ncbi:MAG: NAD(P)H-hydrate epimerase [candidate division KSB1 bacterium]|nr:NAD(P)H-hydrate epimerase [candidate division KSB1 bacterium]
MNFTTHDGIQVPAVTAEQMREIDRIAVQETGPNLYQMMEHAGRTLAMLAIELLGTRWKSASVLVLTGTGGNGGGGICAARHMTNRNMRVTLCPIRVPQVGTVPGYQYAIYQNTPGREIRFDQLQTNRYDLVIDALIGYSLKGAAAGTPQKMIQWANASGTPILSLDVPSGLDATTGESPGACIRAVCTLTLALPKSGLFQTGNLVLADIGIPFNTYRRIGLEYRSPFGEHFYTRIYARDGA